jgi:Cu2+-exporting ATPase
MEADMDSSSKHAHNQHTAHGITSKMHEMHGVPPNTGMHPGHGRHAGHSVAMFRDRFWLSLALTLPVVLWSSEVQHWLGYRAPIFPGSRWIPAILGTIVFL